MNAITKGMIVLSALISAGLVAAFEGTGSRAGDQTAASQVAQRFPLANEMFTPVSMAQFTAQKLSAEQPAADGRRSDRLPMSDSCARQDWPYQAQQCLVSADGSPAPTVNRLITVERRVSENVSELVRMPVADLAQR
jgi:hypothetical protein